MTFFFIISKTSFGLYFPSPCRFLDNSEKPIYWVNQQLRFDRCKNRETSLQCGSTETMKSIGFDSIKRTLSQKKVSVQRAFHSKVPPRNNIIHWFSCILKFWPKTPKVVSFRDFECKIKFISRKAKLAE